MDDFLYITLSIAARTNKHIASMSGVAIRGTPGGAAKEICGYTTANGCEALTGQP